MMYLSRRALLAGLSAAILGAAPLRASDPLFPVVPDQGYATWVRRFRDRAAQKGISDATLNTAFAGSGFIPAVIEKDRNQFEFSLTLEDYLAITVSDARVKAGRAALQKHRKLLAAIEQAYGVEPHITTAVWGIESFYGTKRGTVPTISALSTLAYEGRRAAFFEAQLIAALKILQHGDVSLANMVGGWAGAMGHTQFIPTTYAAFAVDFRGDGRRDIWSNDPPTPWPRPRITCRNRAGPMANPGGSRCNCPAPSTAPWPATCAAAPPPNGPNWGCAPLAAAA